jgi:three-Cys-motif partner protein
MDRVRGVPEEAMASKSRKTRWARGGRTEAKHRVLVEYLGAWIPIFGLQRWVHDLVLVDGFAGPGRHTGGEPGSPLLMLDSYEQHRDRHRLAVTAHFFFIEKDEQRVESLRREIAARGQLPDDVTVDVILGDYAERFPVVVADVRKRWPSCPIFAFIDPFGADTQPELTADLLSLPRCEALTFVPIGYFADFFKAADMRRTLSLVFGGDVFERGADFDPQARRDFLVGMMEDRLRESCRWVRAIELVPTGGSGRTHHLFFGTNDRTGLARMKTAMWKLDPVGGVRFVDSTQPGQVVMFEAEPDLAPLLTALKARFDDRPFTIQEAEDFTLFDTPFLHDSHLKTKTLAPVERAGELVAVDPPPGRRKSTYEDGIKLRFVEPVSDQRLF